MESVIEKMNEKFFENVIKTDDCWLWIGSKASTGYGDFRSNNVRYKAHRYSYLIHYGKLPNKFICHKCNNPLCVNPSHLYAGDALNNVSDMIKAGRQNNQVKTHCPNGHEYTPDNTYIHKNGSRRCKSCAKLYSKNKRRA